MIRKVIELGNKSHSLTLPIQWLRRIGIKSGDELEVEEKGQSLILSHNLVKEEETILMQLDSENKNRIVRTIRALYKKGHKLVRINFSNEKVSDRDGKSISTHKLIEETVKQLEGFIITSKGENFAVIECIADDKLFENALRRSFLVLLEMSEMITSGLLENNKETLNEATSLYQSLKALTDYCCRTLNRQLIGQISHTILTYSLVETLEGIGDSYRHIAKHFQNYKPTKTTKAIAVKMQELIRLMYQLYYSKNPETLEQYFNIRDELYMDIYRRARGQDKAITENYALIRWLTTRVVDNLL